MRTKKLNNKGFTLVEVIVVAVIVAVLALVAIQLYTGYVKEARLNTAENLAAAAASYLQTEANRGNVYGGGDVAGGDPISIADATDPAVFQVPENSWLDITATMVTAYVGSGEINVTSGAKIEKSSEYPWSTN